MTHHAGLDPDTDLDVAEPTRPTRPAPIELAAAILIVGGAIGLFGSFTAASNLPAGSEPILALTVALDLGSILTGVSIRYGRLWIVAVNYVAILGFLDLMASGASPLALMLGLADVVVVIILLLHKPWFDALGRWRSNRRDELRRLSP